jgi:HptB-dependent secretion and biofilm anti anti-sigma factor
MDINTRSTNQSATIGLSGRFDFHVNRPFREACEAALKGPGIKELDIDLSRVDYMDSSALGMLLLIREYATANNQQMSLSGCKGTVKQILDIANFGRLFTIT